MGSGQGGRARAAAVAVALLGMAARAPAHDPPAAGIRVSGWFGTTWDFPDGFRSFYDHADRISQASPFWFHPLADGSVTAYEPDAGSTGKRLADVESLVKAVCAAHGVTLIPTVGEPPASAGKDVVRGIMADDRRRAAHERALVELA